MNVRPQNNPLPCALNLAQKPRDLKDKFNHEFEVHDHEYDSNETNNHISKACAIDTHQSSHLQSTAHLIFITVPQMCKIFVCLLVCLFICLFVCLCGGGYEGCCFFPLDYNVKTQLYSSAFVICILSLSSLFLCLILLL